MSKSSPPISSFNAGEWGVNLRGRTDLQKYPSSARTLQNFIPKVQGPAFKRSGTRFVKEPPASVVAGLRVSTGSFTTSDAPVGSVIKLGPFGFTAKCIIVWSTGVRGALGGGTIRNTLFSSYGFGTGADSQYSVCGRATDGVTTTDSGTASRSNRILFLQKTTVESASLTFLGAFAELTIEETSASFPQAVPFRYMALGGDALEAEVFSFFSPLSTGAQSVGSLAFQPDAALFISDSNISSQQQAGTTNLRFCVGAAAGDPTIANACVSLWDDDGVTTTDTASYGRADECLALMTTDGNPVAIASVTNWESGGIELTWSSVSGAERAVGCLALKTGGAVELVEGLTQTDTTTEITVTTASKARGGLFFSHTRPESVSGTGDAGGKLSLGAFTSTVNQSSLGYSSRDAIATASEVRLTVDLDAVYSHPSLTSTAVEGSMQITDISDTTITALMDDADPAQALFWALLVESGVTDSTNVALIPFEFNVDDTHMLEFGNQYMRVYTDNGIQLEAAGDITGATQANPVVITQVAHGYSDLDEVFIESIAGMTELNGRYFTVTALTADTYSLNGEDGTGHTAYTSGGTGSRVFQISTPYADTDVSQLFVEQSADVFYLTHPTYPPQKLQRMDSDDWTIQDLPFDWHPFSKENTDTEDLMTPTGETGSIKIYSNQGRFLDGHVGGYVRFRERIQSNHNEWAPNTNMGTAWIGGNGIGQEVFYEQNVYELTERNGSSTSTGAVAPTHDNGTKSDGRYDWTYLHSGAGYARIDQLVDKYEAIATVIKTIPNPAVDGEFTITSATAANPVVITTSAVNPYKDGNKVFLREVTGQEELNDRTFEINQLSTTTFQLLGEDGSARSAGTAGRVVRVTTDGNSASAAVEGAFRDHDLWSFSAFSNERGYPRAVVRHEDRLWLAGTTADPQGVWASVTGEYENFQERNEDDASGLVIPLDANDPVEWLSTLSALTIGTGSVEMASQRDGAVLTAETVQQIRPRTAYGSRRGVFPVRIGNAIIFAQRAGLRLREFSFDEGVAGYSAADLMALHDEIALGLVERLAVSEEPDRIVWCMLESGDLVALTYEREQDVIGWHRHVLGGTDVKVRSLAVKQHPNGDKDQLWLYVTRTINGATRRYVEFLESNWLSSNSIETAFFVDSGLTYDSTPVTNVTGLSHLEGEAVSILADGLEVTGRTVSGGTLDTALATAASVIHVGLAYNADYESQNLESGGDDGTAQGKLQRVRQVVMRLQQTGLGLQYGPDLSNLRQTLQITAGTLFDGDTKVLSWPAGNERGSRVAVRHASPLPCTILALYPRMNTE